MMCVHLLLIFPTKFFCKTIYDGTWKRRCAGSMLVFCSQVSSLQNSRMFSRSAWGFLFNNSLKNCSSSISLISRPSLVAVQEISNNARFLCASILLDQKPDHLQQYLANAVYESCRGGELKLQGFPEFGPLIQGLKESTPEVETHQYQVCAKRGSKLVVLGSLANKWLQSEDFSAEAASLIENHNKNFNVDGDFVEEETERTHGTFSPYNPWLTRSLVTILF